MCDLRAALSLALGSPPSVSARRFPAAAKTLCATFGAALSLTLGSPLCGGGFRRRRSRSARFAASVRRFPAAAKTLCATFRRRSRLRPVRRLVRRSRSARFAAWRRSSSCPACRFGAAVSGGGKDSLCDLRRGALARARLVPSVFGGALARTRLAASWRRRSRSARFAAFVAALSLAPGSPPSVFGGGFRRRQRLFVRPFGGALAHARFAARAQSRAQ